MFLLGHQFNFAQSHTSQETTITNPKVWIDELLDYYNKGMQEKVVQYADSILESTTPLNEKDSLNTARIYHIVGKAQFEQFANYKSIETLHIARSYAENVAGNDTVLSGIYYYLHINFGVQSKTFETLKYGEKALYILENTMNPNYDLLLKLYGRMAVYSATAGSFNKSRNYLKKGKQFLQDLPDHIELPNPRLSYEIKLLYRKMLIAFVSDKLNLDDKINNSDLINSVEFDKKKLDLIFNKDKDLLSNQSDDFNYDDANVYYYTLALNYYSLFKAGIEKTDYNLLHKEIDKAIELLHKKHHARHLYQFKNTKAVIFSKQGKYEEAMSLYDTIIANTNDNNNIRANFYISRALVAFQQKDVIKAQEDIYKALTVIHQGEEVLKKDYTNFNGGYRFNNVVTIHSLANRIKLLEYDFDNKESYYTSIFEVAFKQFTTTYKNQGLNKVTRDFFNSIVNELAAKNALTNSDLSQIENVQNFLAWKSFNQSRNIIQLPVVDSLEQIEFTIRKQLTRAKQTRDVKAIDSITRVLYNFEQLLKKNYPDISKSISGDFDIVNFQKNLKNDEIVLKYAFFKDEFALFQITKDSIFYELKPWLENEQQMLRQHLDNLKKPFSKMAYDNSLVSLLIPDKAHDFKNLIIIPDGVIYPLPFETLSHNNRFLIEDKTVRYSSHLRFVNGSSNIEYEKDLSLTIYAPEYTNTNQQIVTRSSESYLNGARSEAIRIAEIFNAESFLGKEATKNAFVNNRLKGDVLHLAMHATINKDDAVLSYFNFSDQEKLHIEELYGLKMDAKLAVLSACNTGVYKESKSSGPQSFQRAFTFAGVPATVASLWEVPDNSTKQIMERFYTHLSKGQTKSQSLQNAKLDYLNVHRGTKLGQPYYWAGFVVYGEDAPITAANSQVTLYIALAVILLVILTYFFLRTRSKKEN
ncbi:tetratricopeptide repeat domain protein [Nonlabens dokdonensis DSW-6]|jgi:CHAT domain-containing protein|uniref:Tetratricopeptide repeat domain protein n=2 Tax=Nonlabens dokdonensis TaxID=328515 RepID=L7W955_NONDD|nr:tetratricopeptide repeat domain protein [Nonlabens dokdonensis DSW-6]